MVIVFGAGNNLNLYLDMLLPARIKIKYIVDNDNKKWGEKIRGIEICSPKILKEEKGKEDLIIISVHEDGACNQIMKQLKDMGFIFQKDYVVGKYSLYTFMLSKPGIVSGQNVYKNRFIETKTADCSSKLCKLHDSDRIFRVVSADYEEQYKKVFKILKEKHLLGRYVVDTWEANIIDGAYVLEHKFINPVSYCFEWSSKMFEDYIRFMLELIKRLTEADLALIDGHHLNATLYEGEYVYLDFGAIRGGYTAPRTIWEFVSTHILPLVLMKKGEEQKAYIFLKNPGIMYSVSDVCGYLSKKEQDELERLYFSILLIKSKEDIFSFIKSIGNFIEKISVEKRKTKWISYQEDEWNWADKEELWSEKMISFERLFMRAKPNTVADLAGNMGYYGTHIHKNVDYSIVIDYDDMCVDDLWARIKEKEIKNVFPIFMSICSPTLDYYKDFEIGESGIVPWRTNAFNRFKSDMVIALAIVHHLAFSYQLTFREIIKQFSLFTKRWLLIEFIEKTDRYIQNFIKEGFEWYTREEFEIELKKSYTIVEVAESTPKDTRIMYLCERKERDV